MPLLFFYSSSATGQEIQKVPPTPKNSRKESAPPPPVRQGPVDVNRYGYSLKAKELAWREKVDDILISKMSDKIQNLSNLVCYFSVNGNGSIVGPVKFSRTLSPTQSKYIEDTILESSPLPHLPGDTRKKVFFEIVKNSDSHVNFVEE